MASVSAHQASLVTELSLSLDDCLKSSLNRPFHLGVNQMEVSIHIVLTHFLMGLQHHTSTIQLPDRQTVAPSYCSTVLQRSVLTSYSVAVLYLLKDLN